MDRRESLSLVAEGSGRYVVVEVPLGLIDPPDAQLRIDLDADRLEELARSIGREGLINVPTVRKVGDRFRVVAGHRRVEAVRLLGWPTMPVRVQDTAGDSGLALAAHENLFRADLSPVEEAGAVKALLDEVGGDLELCSRRINRTRGWVDSRLRILAWPADVQEAVHAGSISAAAGAELALITEDGHRSFLLGHAVGGGATARTCQAWRIAWEQTGTVSTASVQQVAPGRTPPPPVEAVLPCYFCGDQVSYSGLTHIWLCAEGLELFTRFREAYYGREALPGDGGGGGPAASGGDRRPGG